jgi:hypothetical protein
VASRTGTLEGNLYHYLSRLRKRPEPLGLRIRREPPRESTARRAAAGQLPGVGCRSGRARSSVSNAKNAGATPGAAATNSSSPGGRPYSPVSSAPASAATSPPAA